MWNIEEKVEDLSGEIHSRRVKETVLGVHVDDPQGSKKGK